MKKLLLVVLVAGVTCDAASAALPSNQQATVLTPVNLLRIGTIASGIAYTQIPAEYTKLSTVAAFGTLFGAVYLQNKSGDPQRLVQKTVAISSGFAKGICTITKSGAQAVKNQEGKTGIVLGIGAAYGLGKLWNATSGLQYQDVIVASTALGLVGPWVKEAVIDNYQLGQEIEKVNNDYYTKDSMQKRYQQVIDYVGTQPQKQNSWLGWACHGGWIGWVPRIFGSSYNRYVDLYNALKAKINPQQQVVINTTTHNNYYDNRAVNLQQNNYGSTGGNELE